MRPAAARKALLRDAERRERVQRVVDFMNQKVGYGWARRMESRDRYMDQDYPKVWLSGRKLVSARNLIRFEQYAARFGFQPPSVPVVKPTVQLDVLNMLNTVNSAPMSDVLENISDVP